MKFLTPANTGNSINRAVNKILTAGLFDGIAGSYQL
jgi:hypothetical protein